MPEQDRVEPRTLKGFQDRLPENVIPRKAILQQIETVLQRYGFVPVETPAIEYLDTLLGTGGEETNKELFQLESPEGDKIALRFDLTVPFARLLAQYPDRLKVPFRRYATGSVWRADKPGPGRFREFTQFDADAAGSDSVAVDAEIMAVMCEVMAALGATDYTVIFNNRKLLDALVAGHGITEPRQQKHVLRVVDKLAKVGMDNVRMELGEGRIDDSGDPIPGVHLDKETIDHIVRFITMAADTRTEMLSKLEDLLPSCELKEQAVIETRDMLEALDALGVDERHARFSPSLTRGLDYYTGPVFEMILPTAPEFGSVMGGGRYNQLVERFMERPIPGTGVGIGVDRLIAALTHLGVVAPAKTTTQVLVASVGNVAPRHVLEMATELRAAGLCVQSYLGPKAGLRKQLSHADHYEIPVAVILGEDELAKGLVAIKDLLAGKQQREGIADHDAYRQAGTSTQVTVPRENAAAEVRRLLAG